MQEFKKLIWKLLRLGIDNIAAVDIVITDRPDIFIKAIKEYGTDGHTLRKDMIVEAAEFIENNM